MKYLFILLLTALFLISCNDNSRKVLTVGKPNIIFILADDLGYADIEPFGQKIIQTPELIRLAAEGMIFTDHYSGNTVCAPSRYSLMTGLHPGNAYVRGNRQSKPTGQLPLPEGTTTVSTLLKSAGYNTAMIGKWALGNVGNSGDPVNFGWDLSYGYNDQILAHNYYPEFLIRNGKKEYLQNEVKYLSKERYHKGLGSYSTVKKEYSHDLMVNEALQFIRNQKEDPFFFYLPLLIPHSNPEAPSGERLEVPDFGIYEDSVSWNKETKGYAAMISRLDKDVGRIVDLLIDLNLEKNTIVIFTSDNGAEPGEVFTDYFNSNGPFRGGKRDMYEGGIRAPMIAWWPGTIEAGKVNNHISAFWDFLPTACDLAGIEIPENIDGISFLPALLGESQQTHKYLYWEFPSRGFKTAVRKGKWKAVQARFDQELELYNLDTDPGEENNVASEYPVIVEEMKDIINEAHTPSALFPRPDELKE